MHTHFKVFASYNILQYLCDFIHDLIFVTLSKCQESPKLTNIVIYVKVLDDIDYNEYEMYILNQHTNWTLILEW